MRSDGKNAKDGFLLTRQGIRIRDFLSVFMEFRPRIEVATDELGKQQ
jgi:hypothetical protein